MEWPIYAQTHCPQLWYFCDMRAVFTKIPRCGVQHPEESGDDVQLDHRITHPNWETEHNPINRDKRQRAGGSHTDETKQILGLLSVRMRDHLGITSSPLLCQIIVSTFVCVSQSQSSLLPSTMTTPLALNSWCSE